MTYSFHPDAALKLNDLVNYYQECKDELGSEFAYEVQKTIQRILKVENKQLIDCENSYYKIILSRN